MMELNLQLVRRAEKLSNVCAVVESLENYRVAVRLARGPDSARGQRWAAIARDRERALKIAIARSENVA